MRGSPTRCPFAPISLRDAIGASAERWADLWLRLLAQVEGY